MFTVFMYIIMKLCNLLFTAWIQQLLAMQTQSEQLYVVYLPQPN